VLNCGTPGDLSHLRVIFGLVIRRYRDQGAEDRRRKTTLKTLTKGDAITKVFENLGQVGPKAPRMMLEVALNFSFLPNVKGKRSS
jgi:hypothetical protein